MFKVYWANWWGNLVESNPLLCSGPYWWLPALLPPVLLVLFAFVVLWLWGRWRGVDWHYEWIMRSWPSRLIRSLLLLYSLFFVFLVSSEFLVRYCQPLQSAAEP